MILCYDFALDSKKRPDQKLLPFSATQISPIFNVLHTRGFSSVHRGPMHIYPLICCFEIRVRAFHQILCCLCELHYILTE
jgi:hypothetical protein